jgi:Family of unknown function (DUF6308)
LELTYGAQRVDRRVTEVETLLQDWHEKESESGQIYLIHVPATPRDQLLVEDLAVTMLVNSLAAGRAAWGVHANGASLDLSALPDKALEETTAEERHYIAGVIREVATWPGIKASLASKILHKKRPALIPMLDNRAIFEAYMEPRWPERRTAGESVNDIQRINAALDWIAFDLTRPENTAIWTELRRMEPDRTRIELFDMIWWRYFRRLEPR